jgi:branched-chain amino acid transport system ATP-binding protein
MIRGQSPDLTESSSDRVPALEASRLTAGYGPMPVIHDVSFRVYGGEVMVLLGSNGAGKTTTILTLAGELVPLSGEVRMRGAATTGALHLRARRGLRLVTEERSVFMSLTVAANLKLLHNDISECLDLFPELQPLLKRKAGVLSGGEQQMLSLARALAGSPEIVLIDELSLGLAPLVLERLLLAVRAAADRGVAVVLVEQQIRYALSVADRGCVMRRGEIVLEGAAAELRKDPAKIGALYLGGTG